MSFRCRWQPSASPCLHRLWKSYGERHTCEVATNWNSWMLVSSLSEYLLSHPVKWSARIVYYEEWGVCAGGPAIGRSVRCGLLRVHQSQCFRLPWPIVQYFQQHYIGVLKPDGTRRTLMFPRQKWNVYDATILGEDGTNNAQDGWHCKFASRVTCHHPTLWKHLDAILEEQTLTERVQERMAAGHNSPPRKKKCRLRSTAQSHGK